MDKNPNNLEEVVTNGSKVMRAEVEQFTKNNEKSNFYKKMADYMFWGATTVLAGLIAGATKIAGATLSVSMFGLPATATLLGMPILAVIGGVVAIAAFVGSVSFSSKSAEIDSHNTVLGSDIDSRNQAHRMVQAFAKVQAPTASVAANQNNAPAVPFVANAPTTETNWANRVGGSSAAMAEAQNWTTRVNAERQAEEVQALNLLQR